MWHHVDRNQRFGGTWCLRMTETLLPSVSSDGYCYRSLKALSDVSKHCKEQIHGKHSKSHCLRGLQDAISWLRTIKVKNQAACITLWSINTKTSHCPRKVFGGWRCIAEPISSALSVRKYHSAKIFLLAWIVKGTQPWREISAGFCQAKLRLIRISHLFPTPFSKITFKRSLFPTPCLFACNNSRTN